MLLIIFLREFALLILFLSHYDEGGEVSLLLDREFTCVLDQVELACPPKGHSVGKLTFSPAETTNITIADTRRFLRVIILVRQTHIYLDLVICECNDYSVNIFVVTIATTDLDNIQL